MGGSLIFRWRHILEFFSGFNNHAGGNRWGDDPDPWIDTASFVGGGMLNDADAKFSVICGGCSNFIADDYGQYGTICGGYSNLVGSTAYERGQYGFVGGGYGNRASHNYSAVVGGKGNGAGEFSFVGGGEENVVDGWFGRYSVICGGRDNRIGDCYHWAKFNFIGCGDTNEIYGNFNSILGGKMNLCDTTHFSLIGTGEADTILGSSPNRVNHSGILTGTRNKIIKADYALILSGTDNTIQENGDNSIILGGSNNNITATYSLAFGREITASSPYTAIFFSDDYPGKLGINEENPAAELDVNGSAKINGAVINKFTITSGPYTIQPDDHTIFTSYQVNLPDASANPGKVYYIKNTSSIETIPIYTLGGNIDTASSYSLPPLGSIIVQSDGSNWWVIAEK